MTKQCPICLEEIYVYKNTLTINCNHIFHINCYTQYVIHETKKVAEEMNEVKIKCPMCRSKDTNMIIPLLETIEDSINTELCCNMFIDDVEDIIIKQLFPVLLTILEGNRLSKRNLKSVLRKMITENEKELKIILKDIKKN